MEGLADWKCIRTETQIDQPLRTFRPTALSRINEDEQVLFVPEYDSTTETASFSSADSFELIPDYTEEEFLHLIHAGDSDQVIAILDSSPYRNELIKAADSEGNSVLHYAVRRNSTPEASFLRTLLQRGADVNMRNIHGETPLIAFINTSRRDDVEIPATLLFFGANPNLRLKNGSSALHLAMKAGYRYIGQLLVKRGAALNVPDKKGVLPWEVDRSMKIELFQSIRYAPSLANPNARSECMACGVFYEHVRCSGNCVHCGRACCVNCLKNRVNLNRLPPTFFTFAPEKQMQQRKAATCTTCFEILEDRYRNEKSKKTLVVRIFGNYEQVF